MNDLKALILSKQNSGGDQMAAVVATMVQGMQASQQMMIASANAETRRVLNQCCDLLIAAEEDLNALDLKSGDGDTGSTLATAARALKGSLDRCLLPTLRNCFAQSAMS